MHMPDIDKQSDLNTMSETCTSLLRKSSCLGKPAAPTHQTIQTQ